MIEFYKANFYKIYDSVQIAFKKNDDKIDKKEKEIRKRKEKQAEKKREKQETRS